jgi:hypothetical protein
VPRNYSSSSKPVMASVPSSHRESSYSQGYSQGYSSFGWNGGQGNYRSAYQQPDRFGIW